MKKHKHLLDVDFIGGEGPLTPEEKEALNNYFKAKKAKTSKTLTTPKKRISMRKKSLA